MALAINICVILLILDALDHRTKFVNKIAERIKYHAGVRMSLDDLKTALRMRDLLLMSNQWMTSQVKKHGVIPRSQITKSKGKKANGV